MAECLGYQRVLIEYKNLQKKRRFGRVGSLRVLLGLRTSGSDFGICGVASQGLIAVRMILCLEHGVVALGNISDMASLHSLRRWEPLVSYAEGLGFRISSPGLGFRV